MLCLYYLSKEGKREEFKEIMEILKTKEIELKDMEQMVIQLRIFVQEVLNHDSKKTETVENQAPSTEGVGAKTEGDEPYLRKKSGSNEQIDFTLPEVFKKIEMNSLMNMLSEEFNERKEQAKKKQQELQQLKNIQKEEETKKREEEEKAKRDKQEEAFQEYIKRIELRNKLRSEHLKKEYKEKELKIKEEEERRKHYYDMIIKREEERKNKRIQDVRKKAEIEKKEVELYEKQQQKNFEKHYEKQNKAFEEWNSKKNSKLKNKKNNLKGISEIKNSNSSRTGLSEKKKLYSSLEENDDLQDIVPLQPIPEFPTEKSTSTKQNKPRYSYTSDNEDSETKKESRGKYIKRLLHTVSQGTIKEEKEESESYKRSKGPTKKPQLSDIEYQIMSVYNAPLPHAKLFSVKKRSPVLVPSDDT